MPGEVRIELREFTDLARWRLALVSASGELLADHEVRLDPGCWQYAAFSDLSGYVQQHAGPDNFTEAARIVAEVVDWIGPEVLGPFLEPLFQERPDGMRVALAGEVPAAALVLVQQLTTLVTAHVAYQLGNALTGFLTAGPPGQQEAGDSTGDADPEPVAAIPLDLRLPAGDQDSMDDMAGAPERVQWRFTGQADLLARAGAALAAGSGLSGVLLHGMPGGGKTACALRLAYVHEDDFDRLVWYKAPDEGRDAAGALADFALILERYFPGLEMTRLLAGSVKLAEFTPRLTGLMARRVLIILDNVESLLGEDGQWRDRRWEPVFSALSAAHGGPGRLIVTSRVRPPGAEALHAEAVDGLPPGEARELARNLPGLRLLFDGRVPRQPNADPGTAGELARRALTASRGSPLLLELAEGQATRPERLTGQIQAGEQAWQERGEPASSGEASEPDARHQRLLAAWIRAASESLAPGQRVLFWCLCCLEEADRDGTILDLNWAGLWQRLHRRGPPPGTGRALDAIAARGLARVRALDAPYGVTISQVQVHPAVAAAGRAQAGTAFQDAVDYEMAAFWNAMFGQATGMPDDAGHTALMMRAALAATPYLLRLLDASQAGGLLTRAFSQAPSPANAAAMLSALQWIAADQPAYQDTLDAVLGALDAELAEDRLRFTLSAAEQTGDPERASAAATRLIQLYIGSGQLTQAQALAEEKADPAMLGLVFDALAEQAQRELAEQSRTRLTRPFRFWRRRRHRAVP